MERVMPVASFNNPSSSKERDYYHIPPWEQQNRDNVVQVPFMGRSRSPLPPGKQHENSRHKAHDLTPTGNDSWQTNTGIPPAPRTAPGRTTAQSPYESVKIPQGPISAPHVPAFVKNDTYAPESIGSHGGLYQPPYQSKTHEATSISTTPAPAFPGTMAARQQELPRQRSNSARSRPDEKPNAFKRCLSSFKNAFKRDPIDERDFERIEDKHWSE